MICASLALLQIMFAVHRFAQGATALRAEGCGIALTGDEYEVSVTGFAFSVIWYDNHSADWLAALASPYPASPDFPRKRGQNKTPRNTLFINGSTVSTGYSAPACGGKVVAPATKGGMHFHARQGGCMVFLRAKPGCPVFAAKGGIYTGAEGAVPRQRSDTI